MLARANPFATSRVLGFRYRFEEGGWDGFFDRLARFGNRGAIVGEEGRGKTTLLEDLAERLAERGFDARLIRISAGERRLEAEHRRLLFADPGPRVFLLVDGADQLGPLAWRRVVRAGRGAGGLVVTSHQEGLLPTLYRPKTSAPLLDAIVRTLSGEAPEAFGDSADALWRRHGGNVRTALRDLYDLCARRPPC